MLEVVRSIGGLKCVWRFTVCAALGTSLLLAQERDPQEKQPEVSQPGQKPKTENPAEPEAHGTRVHWQDLPKNILRDEKAIWTSPLHINRENAKWWLIFGGATAALIAADRKMSNGLPNTRAQISASRWASRLGADYSIYPLAATFYIAGKVGDNPRARDTSRIGIEALADAEIAVNIVKVITQRPRPTEKDGHGRFWDGGDSFPSGHTIKSWALARVVALEFNRPRIIPVLAYGLATTVSVSRFAGRKHFASDALVGGAMGWFIGDYVYRKHHAPSSKSKVISWLATHVQPEFVLTR